MGPTITNITSSLDMMNSPNPCTSEEKSERSAEAQKTEEEVPQLHPPEELGCQMPSTSSGDDHRIISPMDRHLYEEKRNEMIQRSKELCRRLAKLQMKETAYFAHDSLGNFVRQTSGRMSHLQAGLSLLSLGFDEKLVKKLAILQENGSLPANGFLRSDLAQMSPEGLVKVLQRYKRSGRKIPPDLMPKLNTAHKQHFTPDGVNSEQLMREIDFVKDLLDETKRGRDWDSDATDTDDSDSEDMLASIRRTATKLGGGEQRFPTNEKSATVIEKSYRWKWNCERTLIGSRLSWLQSEVTDLDYKIRQHADIHRRVRSSKPQVTLESPVKADSTTDELNEESETCARVKRIRSTKRKVVNIQGMYRFNKKAHRLSTVHCGCSPPYSPCVMCCGRTNNIQTQPDIAGLSVPEKYALIDHDYHIVLSDPKDTGLEPRMAAAATINSTRQRPLKRSTIKKVLVAGVPLGTVPFHETSLHRRSSRNEIPLTELPAKVSVKRSCSSDSFLEVDVSQPEPVESEISRVLGRLKSSSRSNSGAATPSGISPLCISLSTSLNETGMPSPRPNGTAGKPGQVTSRRSTAAPQFYDIDNIIIDPSVAAVTRVEKLQYKEIMTPGWKEIDNYMEDGSHPLEVSEEMDSSQDLEEFSDADFGSRHWEKEMLEKRKFETYKSWTVGSSLHRNRLTCVSTTESPSASPSHYTSLSSSTASFSGLDLTSTTGTTSPQSLPYPMRKFPLEDVEYVAILNEQHEVETAIERRKYEEDDKMDDPIMWD